MNTKENTLNVIEKPKIRVIKKIIKKRPPTTLNNNNNVDSGTDKLSEQLTNLKINETTTTSTTQPPVNTQKKSDILKKTIREKVHFDKLTFNAQMSLIEETTTEHELKTHYYDLFQPEHYTDVIQERSSAGKCGYPCCNNLLISSKKLNQKFLISIKEQKIYNVEELSMFCSPDCLIKSKLYYSTLDETAVYLRGVESKKLSPSENISSTSSSKSSSTTTTTTTPTTTTTQTQTPQPMDILNKFEKSLTITENENASLIPPDLTFGKKNHEKPIIITKTESSTKNKEKKKIIITEDVPILKNDDIKIRDSDEDEDDSDELDIDSDEEGFGDEHDLEAPMMLNEEPSDEEEDTEKSEGDKSEGDKSDDEFSLFRPTIISNKKITELFKPSNYHLVYSALSQFTTKHTNNYLQFNQVNYEYILEQNLQIKNNLHSQLSLVYQSVTDHLSFKITTGRDRVTMLIDTFRFDKPVPSLRRNHWKMLILVFLKSLTLIDKDLLKDIEESNVKFEGLVKECGFDMETLRVFQDLLVYGYN